MFNPSASASSRKVISLPPTKERISRISLSASPDQEDCVVAALNGPFLSLCRPGDSEWTSFVVPFLVSEMIYSERDGKFYLNKVGREEYNGPVDLVDTSSSGFPQARLLQGFPFSDIPKSRLEQLSTGTKSQHSVESPSGESFIVYWLDQRFKASRSEGPPYQSSIRIKPRGFVVFRQDLEQKITSYTEDIGHLCIFLGRNEAFCVSATEYPGLKPNSIYFAKYDIGFGFYDLSTNTLHGVIDPPPFVSRNHWLAPLQ